MNVHAPDSKRDPAKNSPAKAWLRALEMTAPIAANPARTLPAMLDELADKHGNAPALMSDAETLSYRALAARANRYARWALAQGLWASAASAAWWRCSTPTSPAGRSPTASTSWRRAT